MQETFSLIVLYSLPTNCFKNVADIQMKKRFYEFSTNFWLPRKFVVLVLAFINKLEEVFSEQVYLKDVLTDKNERVKFLKTLLSRLLRNTGIFALVAKNISKNYNMYNIFK
jgi:hypothetical protein